MVELTDRNEETLESGNSLDESVVTEDGDNESGLLQKEDTSPKPTADEIRNKH
jgi:hypothetical protein